MPLHVGFLEIEILLPTSASLKERRRVVRGLQDRLRARHNLAVIDISEDGVHRRGALALVSIASAEEPLERLFDRVVEEAELRVPGGVRQISRETLGLAG